MESHRKQLLEQIMSSMGELHRCFATSRDSFLATFNLSRPQMDLLFSLKHGSKTTGQLAKRFSITSSAVSQMVDQLETKGLVERINDTKDRRVTNVKLAPEAVKVFQSVRNKFISHLKERFTNVTNDELETLLNILTKTVNNIEKDTAWKK